MPHFINVPNKLFLESWSPATFRSQDGPIALDNSARKENEFIAEITLLIW